MMSSFLILSKAVWETLAISIPAVVKAPSAGAVGAGRLSVDEADRMLRRWAQRLLSQAEVTLVVSGEEHLPDPHESLIVVSNHQSVYDIPVLYCALPFSFRMAAKKELFKTPIWGKAMTAAGFVEIDRKDRQRAHQALGRAGRELRTREISLHIAPEGTRSKTGQLGPFKGGAFELAFASQLRILPVCISGAIEVHRSGSFEVHKGKTVSVDILPPLDPKTFGAASELREVTRSAIAASLSS